jgi:hypothetical protein
MRTRPPLPLLILAAHACAASDAGDAVFIPDFTDRSMPIECTPVPSLTAREASVTDVAMLGDTAFLVLYGLDRELAVVGQDLVPRRLFGFAEDGPTGVLGPTSATIAGDSLVYIADQKRMALRRFDLAGQDRGTIRLDFAPDRVLATDDGRILITPLVVGRHPRWLVYAIDGEDATPLGIPAAHYANPAVNALANLARFAAFPDGRVVATHTTIVPYAYTLSPGDASPPDRAPLPLPDDVRPLLGKLPAASLEDDRLGELLVATIATAPDTRSGDLLYLTRSGRTVDGRPEKAIVRVDPGLRYLRSYLLVVNAIHLAYLAGPQLTLVADEVDQWYRCPTP